MGKIKWKFFIPILIGIVGTIFLATKIEYMFPKKIQLKMTDVELSSETKDTKYYKGYYKKGDFKISKIVKEGAPELNGKTSDFYEIYGTVMMQGEATDKTNKYIILLTCAVSLIISSAALWGRSIRIEKMLTRY